MAQGTGTGNVLANRPFLALWIAQVLSQTAQNAIIFALLVLIEERHGSTLYVSMMILSAILPAVFFGIAAGVVVDHVHKKAVLVTTNLLRAIACLGFVLVSGSTSLLYAVNFVFATISQFFAPAETAAIPQLVKRSQLLAANGLFSLTFSGAQVLGFVIVGPPLVKLAGPEGTFAAIGGIYLVAGLLVSLLPRAEPPQRPLSGIDRSALWSELGRDVREGWRLLSGDRAISLAMVQLTAMGSLILVLGVLAPAYVKRVLEVRADDAVLILAPAAVGILLGTSVMPRLSQRVAKQALANWGLGGLGLMLLLLAVAGELVPITRDRSGLVALIMSSAFLIGLSFSFTQVPAQTILQERTPGDLRGRVFATQLTMAFVVSVVPLIFVGGLADLLGVGRTLLLMAGFVLLLCLYSLAQTRKLLPNLPLDA